MQTRPQGTNNISPADALKSIFAHQAFSPNERLLLAIRVVCNQSLYQFAAALGVAPPSLSAAASNAGLAKGRALRERAAAALGLTHDELFGAAEHAINVTQKSHAVGEN